MSNPSIKSGNQLQYIPMATTRDYYEILGLKKGASLDELKKAYRNLARTHHPDVDKTTGAEERFKEINEAYQILSDPQKKAAYDQFGHAAFRPGGRAGAGFNPFGGPSTSSGQWGPFTYSYSTGGDSGDADFSDPFDIFESVFGFRGFNREPRRGRDLNFVMDVEFMEAIKGGGRVVEIKGKEFHVKIPQGAHTGTKIKFAGEGDSARGRDGRELPRGDLYITLRVGAHSKFVREDDDIYSQQNISYSQAVLGDKIDVETAQGLVKLAVPNGTQSGTAFRIKGKGVKSSRGTGDHYVRLNLLVPKNVSRRERELLEEIRKI